MIPVRLEVFVPEGAVLRCADCGETILSSVSRVEQVGHHNGFDVPFGSLVATAWAAQPVGWTSITTARDGLSMTKLYCPSCRKPDIT